MRAKSAIKSIAVLLLAVAVGAGVTWILFDRSQNDLSSLGSMDGGTAVVVGADNGVESTDEAIQLSTTAEPTSSGEGADTEEQAVPEAAGDSRWDDRIRSALTSSSLNLRQKSQQLLGLAAADGSASLDQRLEALDHGLNLVADEDYEEDALRLALRSDLPPELGESILTDLHGRDPELLVGTCQKIAALEDHPLREEALEIVSFMAPELVEEAAD